MGEPDSADVEEAYEIPEKVRPELPEGLRKRDCKRRNSQLEYENRDGYRENPIGKGVESIEWKDGCAALRNAAIILFRIALVVHHDIFLIFRTMPVYAGIVLKSLNSAA